MPGKYICGTINLKNKNGFTLVEALITLAISSIVVLGAFAAYSVQSKSFSSQREIAKLQQDIRGAFYLMEFDFLNANRDPNLSNAYGMTDIRHYDYQTGSLNDIMDPTPFVMPVPPATICFESFPVLEFTSLRDDEDGDGEGDAPMTIRYQVYDFNDDGRLDLGRRIGATPATLDDIPGLVAEGVIAIGYAFAYNASPSGGYRITRRDPSAGGDPLGTIIWAVDTDGDNFLDTNIDITGDGQITIADDISGDGVIDVGDSAAAALTPPVSISNVVAMRMWILVQSKQQTKSGVIDTNRYVVGNRIIPTPGVANPNGFADRYKRRVQTVTVALRNYRKS